MAAPYRELFAWLDGHDLKPDISGRLVFRPLMLAHPIEEGELDRLDPLDFTAEWKWDGNPRPARLQVGPRCGCSHAPATMSPRRFPDIGEVDWG